MTMYNIIHGRNPLATIILAALDLTEHDVGRFRDAFVAENEIAVYTRNGGGYRNCWCENDGEHSDSADCGCPGCIITHRLPKHPNYLRDQDDEFDSTYATIYFSIPEKHREMLSLFNDGKFDPDKRWLDSLQQLKEGKREDVVKALAPLCNIITSKIKGEENNPT